MTEQPKPLFRGSNSARILFISAVPLALVVATDVSFGQPQWPGYQNPDYGECNPGWVWRDAYSGDHTCVLPSSRTEAAQDNQASPGRKVASQGDTCRTGYVWREAFPGDHVCVEPSARDVARSQNQAHSWNVGTSRSGPNGPFLCKQGFVWRVASANDFICVTPDERTTAFRQNQWAAERRGNDACQPGWVWREAQMTDLVCVKPATRDRTRIENQNAALNALSPSCEIYGREAVAQVQEAQRRQCNVSGPRWTPSLTDHVNWCVAERPSMQLRAKEANARRQQLASCGSGTVMPPIIDAELQLRPGSFNLFRVTGSGFSPGSTVTATVTTRTNGGPPTNPQALQAQANSLGQFAVEVGKECPVNQSTVHSAVATDSTGRTSNTAARSC